jgi:hypothetical protein
MRLIAYSVSIAAMIKTMREPTYPLRRHGHRSPARRVRDLHWLWPLGRNNRNNAQTKNVLRRRGMVRTQKIRQSAPEIGLPTMGNGTRNGNMTSKLHPQFDDDLISKQKDKRIEFLERELNKRMIYWRHEKPTLPGFYYWQNQALLNYDRNAVVIVQITGYKNKERFRCETLQAKGYNVNPQFKCELGEEPIGWWCGPLPEPDNQP